MDSPARPSQAKMASSTGGTEGSSPASSPASAASLVAMAAPKYGTVVPNRIFVGGISASTSEAELTQLFSAYGNVKATKIIADRGGVSKGYGFVTFETEEEAKRLQQESECIILRERKLNIAPAIKKQPFNRSFDGGTGSPPAVPTSTYYYANGMGLPYQNGMTFYNTGAPAPGAAIAPPADPAALYQAAGVFGPQATASHQTFAPMMYPVPAPSLYMPQQYQYSPMPYEPYFPGTTAAGAPQFLYATNSAQASTSGSGNGSGTSSSGTAAAAATGATSPASGAPGLGPSPPQFQAHFYGPAGAASHPHHPGSMAGGPHGPPPPPPPQMEHLYYSYPPPPHAAQPPPHHGGPLTLATDQQLLIYSTDMSGQTSANDSQVSQQEDSHSTSSHSEQQQQLQPGGTATSDSGGGGGGGGSGHTTQPAGQPSDPSASAAMLPLVPLKYLLPTRYPNYHPVANLPAPHPQPNSSPQQQQQQPQQSQQQQQQQQTNEVPSDDASGTPPVHYRTMSIYPTPLYIPHHGAPYHSGSPAGSTGGASLLPTPPQQSYDLGAVKYRDYSAGKSGLVGSPYKGPPTGGGGGSPLLHHQSAYVKQFNGPPLQPGLAHHQKYPRVTTPPARLSHHPQYGKRTSGPHHLAAPAYYFSQKSCQYGSPSPRPGHQPFVYGGQHGGAGSLSPYAMPHGLQKGFALGYENAARRSFSLDHTSDGYSNRPSGRKNVNSYRGSNLTMSASASPSVATDANISNPAEPAKVAEQPSNDTNATTITTNTTTTSATSSDSIMTKTSATDTQTVNTSSAAAASSGPKAASSTPPPTSYSPMTRPHPNLSPSPNPNQVQLFGQPSGGSSQRYGNPSSGLSSHHQRGGGSSGSRYQISSSSMSSRGGGGKASSVLRQTSSKYKMNGIVQTSGKLPVDEANLGGAGDAPPRLPITPPTTPQQSTSTGEQQQLSETCHQMQALTL